MFFNFSNRNLCRYVIFTTGACFIIPTHGATTTCDTYAADPWDVGKTASGVEFEAISVDVALNACNQAVNNNPNNARLQYQLGRVYRAKGDFSQALSWYQKAAAQSYAPAQSDLGTLYGSGSGVDPDFQAAFSWFEKAAQQNYAPAQKYLGVLYESGKGTQQSYAKAFEWYEKSALQNFDEAQNNLGNAYRSGLGVAVDLNKAIEWYSKAANQGHAIAQKNLAEMYYYFTGVPTDLDKAWYWFNQSAAQDEADAQDYVGVMTYLGQGTATNREAAFDWFQKAADQGNDWGYLHLGMAYHNGDTKHPRDQKTALSYWLDASDDGLIDASFELVAAWGEKNYPEYLPGFAESNLAPISLADGDYLYRHYSSGQDHIYLGLNLGNQHVYYLGPLSGNQKLDLGNIGSFLEQAKQ